MRVYDTFLFNDELDLLKLRLHWLSDVVDFFVVVESRRTLSGKSKPLHFWENRKLFQPFLHKIIHLEVPVNDLPEWEYEFYQRNFIKQGLQNCDDNDIVFISDADEIINIKEILQNHSSKLPALIELPMYYYFTNLKTNQTFFVNLAAPWGFIKNLDLGFRYRDYPAYTQSVIKADTAITGWHFSYLYGNNIEPYQKKIKAFSHQEYNTPYFLNAQRIKKCIQFAVDLFERPFMTLTVDNKSIQLIQSYLEKANLNVYYQRPSFFQFLLPQNVLFLAHKREYRRLKHYFTKNRN